MTSATVSVRCQYECEVCEVCVFVGKSPYVRVLVRVYRHWSRAMVSRGVAIWNSS